MNLKYFEPICLAIFIALTVTLFLLKLFRVGNRRRGVVKMFTAAGFLLAGAYGCFLIQPKYGWLLLVGLSFAFLGDLLLVFMDRHSLFVAGVISFSAASLTIGIYSVLAYQWRWWSILIFAALMFCNVFMQVKKVYSYGKGIVYLNVYTVLMGLCGSLGFALLCSAASLSMAMFGLGCTMYMLSDVLLGLYLYKWHSPVIDAANTALYFPGMFLIAVSLIL